VPSETQYSKAQSGCADINTLFLIGTGFGWSYYIARDYLESWGVTVTTVARALNLEVESCPNREPRPVIADYLLSDFDMETIDQFDCIYIPSGPHWQGLADSQRVKDFITAAYDAGLHIATQCTGNVALARMNNITADVTVTDYLFANLSLLHPDAIRVDSKVVIDSRLITGGAGGGYTGIGGRGVETAPIYEVCSALVRSVTGSSFVSSCIVEPATGTATESYSITVETANPYIALPEVNSTHIKGINVSIVSQERGDAPLQSLSLNDNGDGTYTAIILDMQEGANIVLDVEDDSGILEVIRNIEVNHGIPIPQTIVFGAVGIAIVTVIIVWWTRRDV